MSEAQPDENADNEDKNYYHLINSVNHDDVVEIGCTFKQARQV